MSTDDQEVPFEVEVEFEMTRDDMIEVQLAGGFNRVKENFAKNWEGRTFTMRSAFTFLPELFLTFPRQPHHGMSHRAQPAYVHSPS
jgi:hypothetical protein